MKIEWKLGSQVCRQPMVGVVELLANDMCPSSPLLIRYRYHSAVSWQAVLMRPNGRQNREDDADCWFDLMPPTLTREEVARECMESGQTLSGIASMHASLNRYDGLIKSGQYVP